MNDKCPICGMTLDANFTENEQFAGGKDIICECKRIIWVPTDSSERPTVIPASSTKAFLCS